MQRMVSFLFNIYAGGNTIFDVLQRHNTRKTRADSAYRFSKMGLFRRKIYTQWVWHCSSSPHILVEVQGKKIAKQTECTCKKIKGFWGIALWSCLRGRHVPGLFQPKNTTMTTNYLRNTTAQISALLGLILPPQKTLRFLKPCPTESH
mmetsp:Transcript_38133/g.75010  ORF Transcript_38133/g.75010 Transcript_38133/m.75010 type:complete len:148 (-) Transcript_38133:571-1014(-)